MSPVHTDKVIKILYSRSSFITRLLLLVILAAVFLIYFPPYSDAFILDDYKHLEWTAKFAGQPWSAIEVLDPGWTGWYYRPVQHWFFLLAKMLYGLTAPGYYAILLSLHALTTALLFSILRALGTSRFGAFCGATLFAFHHAHVEVIGWYSSVSIATAAFFILLSTRIYLEYLNNHHRKMLLPLSVLLYALAHLSREETLFYLPVYVIIYLLVHRGRAPDRRESLALGALVGFGIAYTAIIMTRSTWTRQPAGEHFSKLFEGIQTGSWSSFLPALLWKLILPGDWQLSSPGPADLLITIALLGITFIVLLRSRGALKIGWVIAGCYLLFLYLAIWSVTPATFSDRYLYLPLIGLALAAGGAINFLQRRPSSLSFQLPAAFVVFAFISWQITQTNPSQELFVASADQADSLKSKMLALLPSVPDKAHIFINNLPEDAVGLVIPDYIQAMSAIWYGKSLPAFGGTFERLKQQGWATNDYFVVEYRLQQLVLLMPELQQSSRTILVWAGEPSGIFLDDLSIDQQNLGRATLNNEVAGTEQEARWSLLQALSPERNRWFAVEYALDVPPNSMFRTAVLTAGNQALTPAQEAGVRIRICCHGDSWITAYTSRISLPSEPRGLPVETSAWQEITLDLAEYGEQSIRIRLENQHDLLAADGGIYWANPRITADGTAGKLVP